MCRTHFSKKCSYYTPSKNGNYHKPTTGHNAETNRLKLCIYVTAPAFVVQGLYWLVLCQLDTAGVITEKGASVGEMPP